MARLATSFGPFGQIGWRRDQLFFGMVAVLTAVAAPFLIWPGLPHRIMASDFLPHLYCYLGKPGLIWTHVTADSFIALAYFTISGMLVYLVHKGHREIPFSWMFLAFGVFIVACGGTHLMEVITVWSPVYVLSASVKVVTALASVATAVLLPFTIPQVLALIETAKASEVAEGKFRSLLEAAPDAMVITDESGNIVLVNSQAEKLFGCPRQELLGHPVDTLIPEGFRDQHAAYQEGFSRDPHGRPIPAGLELYARRRNGDEFPVEISLSPLRTIDGLLVTAAIRDITERQRAQETQLRLAAIVESSDDAIISKDLNGTIKSWNAAAERMFGYSEAEAVGQTIMSLFPTESKNEEMLILDRIRAGERIQNYETTRVTKQGNTIDISLTISPMRDPAGRLVGACKIARDITKPKRAERDLQQSEANAMARAEELAAILDAVPGMALIARDPSCHKVTGSRAAYELLRLPYGANISKSGPGGPSHFRTMKGGRELCPCELPIQEAAATAREVRDSEMTIQFDDGSTLDVFGNAVPLLDQKGGVRGAIGVFVDITERKRAEEALREREEKFHQMADNIQEIFWMVDATSKQAIYVNPAFEQITGRTAASLLDAPLSYREIIHADDRMRVLKSLDEAEKTGVLDEEFRILRTDGSVRWVEARGFPVHDAQGKVYRLAGVVQDITERKQVEEALRSSEREQFEIAKQLEMERVRLIEAQAVAKVGSWETELPSLKVSWSEQTHRIFGTDPSHFHPSRPDFAQLVHPEDRAKVDAAFEASLAKPVPSVIEYRIISADGRVKVLEEHWKVICNQQQQPVRLMGTCQDITERRRAEEALRESEDRYRDLVEHSQDLLCTHDLEGNILSCNPAPARILGYEVSELLKMSMRELIAPEFREQFHQYIERLKKNGADSGLLAVVTRTGERRIWEYDNTLRTEGVPAPIVRGMAHDVTERKQAEIALRRSEQDYRLFVAQSSEGIFRQDLESPVPIDLPEDELLHHILYDSVLANCNDAMARMYGLNSAQELIGKRLTDTLDPTDPRNLELAREFVRSGFRVLEKESHEVDVRGAPKIFVNSLIGIVEDGKLLRTWGIQRDITERRQAEQAAQKAQAELTRVMRIATLGELTASIAHEINQPLGAVVTNASAALRWLDAKPPNLHEACEAMAETIEQAELASEVIKRTRILLQKSPSERRPVEINDIIREALALSSNELLRGGVTIHSQIAADLPAVLGDRVQLQQVMLNLILNAVEAMSNVSERPRTLSIKSARDGDDVAIDVQDSGIGLKPEELERIFEPFVTTKAEGIGMGLSISRSIVAAHGGRLWALSGSPHGALFQLRLPAQRACNERVA